MLETLHIRDYAIIDNLSVEFKPGLNVLSGETGAGKSIVVGALGLVLGGRASADVIRSGARKTVLDLIVRLDAAQAPLLTLLEDLDIPVEEDQLILSRSIAADGRNRVLANGRVIPVSVLTSIGDELVDLHGQHEHQSLFKPECQLRLLDACAGVESLVEEIKVLVKEMHQRAADIERLEADDRDRIRQVEFMRHELSEIDGAALIPDEEEQLREQLHRINNAETIYRLASSAYAALYESDGVSAVDILAEALKSLEELEQIDADFREQARYVSEARISIEAVASELRRFTGIIEYDPEQINHLNERLSLISTLKRKYGNDVRAILAYREKTAKALAEFEDRDERLLVLRKEYRELVDRAHEKATILSQKRHKAAQTMDGAIQRMLRTLDMPNASFKSHLEAVKLNKDGIDKLSFMLSANKGEALKPLRQIASGGEISRIMLALKSVFAAQDTVPTLVFDEIDAGIGGSTARRVARALTALAQRHQVICITHLAQIAATAQTHFVIEKSETKDGTTTKVREVRDTERELEIARLLDGSASGASLKHAKVLIDECYREKNSKKE
ncbi:MAG: DNA repair protein RecN [Candidatus Hydrogenedentales bacterium]|jgi:DNA repair protein RecN (Recombination protein N)